MTFRKFDRSLEKIAEDWASRATTDSAWKIAEVGPFAGTESGPVMVRWMTHRTAIAKPDLKKADDRYRTVNEKIASDLGYLLGLPVSPCVLWDRGAGIDPTKERYVSLSQWATSTADHWGVLGNEVLADKVLTSEAVRIFSAMKAFDAWLSADDRKALHVLTDISSSGDLILVFFDFAYFMNWKSENAPLTFKSWTPVAEDPAVIDAVAKEIENFPDSEIDRIIDRIPDEFFANKNQREIIKSNLKLRSEKIFEILAPP